MVLHQAFQHDMTEGELSFPDSQTILGQKSPENSFRFLVCLFFSADYHLDILLV